MTQSNISWQSHKNKLILALEKLEKIDANYRDYSYLTIPFHPEKKEAIGNLITKFRNDVKSLYKDIESEDIYQLCIQFYPVTNIS